MKEHPVVTVLKLGLLAFVGLMLVLSFVGQNETQTKVIRTARAVDEVRDQVAEVRRMLAQGVRAAGPSTGPAPAEDRAPRTPGWTVLTSPEPDTPRPPDDQIDFDAQLRFPIGVESKGMNLYTSDRDAMVALDYGFYVYGSLAERKNSNKDDWKPGLAERVEQSPDRREYRVWIRPGVRWHRPPVDLTDARYAWMKGDHEVTADDLEFTLRMVLDSRADTGGVRSSFEGVESFRAEDRYVFYVKWKQPDFYATGTLLSDLMPLPKWIYTREEDGSEIDEASLGQRFGQHWFNKKMCGYGPYAFKEYKPSESILLERNESWWGRRPAFKTILYKLNIQADETRYNMFFRRDDQGKRDLHVYAFSPVRWRREVLDGDPSKPGPVLDASQVYVYAYQRMMYAYQGWACRGRFFSDARVRRAMTLAANREGWMRDVLADIAINPSGPAFPPSPEYDASIAPWPYDLEQAARLLDEAGWQDRDGNGIREKVIDGETVEFRFRLVDQQSQSPEIDAMRSDWEQSLRKIGVVMTATPYEWNEFIKRVNDREFESVGAAWSLGDVFQPDLTFHSRLIAIPGSDNYVEWSHARADEIMDALKTEFDLQKRYALCHEFHRIFHEEQPYTIGWSWRNPRAHDARIGGWHARTFQPQIDIRDLWWQKDGPARYADGRDKGAGWIRRAGG